MHINKKHILKHLLSWLWSLIPLIGIIDWISPSERNNFIILILAFSAFIIVAFQNKQIDKNGY